MKSSRACCDGSRSAGLLQGECKGWADGGYCVSNPTFMLGATDLGPGCRKSCRRCHANAGIEVRSCALLHPPYTQACQGVSGRLAMELATALPSAVKRCIGHRLSMDKGEISVAMRQCMCMLWAQTRSRVADEDVEGGGTQSRSAVDVLLERRSREAQSWAQRALRRVSEGEDARREQLFFL